MLILDYGLNIDDHFASVKLKTLSLYNKIQRKEDDEETVNLKKNLDDHRIVKNHKNTEAEIEDSLALDL